MALNYNSASRPVYNGTATSRQAQAAWDAANYANGRPKYVGTAASRQAQAAWDKAHANTLASNNGAPAGWKGYNGISYSDAKWYYDYNDKIKNAANNSYQLQQYKNLVKKYGLKDYTAQSNVNEDALRQMSIKALEGDKNAQAYLKNMGYKMDNNSIWSKTTADQFWADPKLRWAYMTANPTADLTKQYDMGFYNKYSDMITNNQPITQDQLDWYNKAIAKWNLEDMRDPYNQQVETLKKDKQNALDAQDVALNQSMAQMDANSFNQFQQLQQQMSNKGLADSGIAADAYLRAQMANNANYQQAFAQAAQNKADTATKYDTDIYGVKTEQLKNQQAQAAEAAKEAVDRQNAQTELLKLQNQQDQWLTQQTGTVYINGKQVLVNGKPINTIDWYKMTETQRHDMATEALTAQKNANDYNVAMDSNAVKREQIAADVQTKMAQMKLDYAKLDYNYAKLEADNKIAQDKLNIMKENAQTSADKAKIDALSKQLSSYTSQIVAYQKAGKNLGSKEFKTLVSNYNKVVGQLQALAGNFNSSSGGGGKYYQSGPTAYKKNLAAANAKGVPSSVNEDLSWIVSHESSFNPNAKNPKSTAYGYAQFLRGTIADYKKKYPNLDYNNPVDQLVLMYHYCVDRYGSVANAKKFWQAHNWY
jgi:hypothetical protein